MKGLAPSLEEERSRTLAARSRGWLGADLINAREHAAIREIATRHWRGVSNVARVVYFVLTAVCVAALSWLLDTLGLPYGLIAAALCLALAEYLIGSRGLFRGGVDEALWAGGLVAFVVPIAESMKEQAILLFAIAFLLAGLRLRQSLFVTFAASLGCWFVAERFHAPAAAATLALLIGLVSFVLRRKPMRYPPLDSAIGWMLIVMPAVAWLLSKQLPASTALTTAILLIGGVIAAILLAGGVVLRDHASLVSGLATGGIVLVELGQWLSWRRDTELIVFGAGVLGAGLVAARLLRSSPAGLTARKLAVADELQFGALFVATAAASSVTPLPRSHDIEREGGSFGGGGASGEY